MLHKVISYLLVNNALMSSLTAKFCRISLCIFMLQKMYMELLKRRSHLRMRPKECEIINNFAQTF